MTKEKRKEIQKQTAAAVEQLGGERLAPLVVFHFVEIGARVAENLTAEQIAEEVKKQEQEEEKAAAEGMACLMSAEFVRWLLEAVQQFAQMPAAVRSSLIKKYY